MSFNKIALWLIVYFVFIGQAFAQTITMLPRAATTTPADSVYKTVETKDFNEPKNLFISAWDANYYEVYDAEVYLDGQFVGFTPFWVQIYPYETHYVELHKPGWSFRSNNYQPGCYIYYDYIFDYEWLYFYGLQTNQVFITSEPSGSNVFNYGIYIGTTPLEYTICQNETYSFSVGNGTNTFTPESVTVTWSQDAVHNLHFVGYHPDYYAAPIAQANPTPISGANHVPTSITRLGWYNHGYAEATGCFVYFGTQNPPLQVADMALNEQLYCGYVYVLPDSLQPGTTYYWKVVPYNSYGICQNAPLWSFTTMADNHESFFQEHLDLQLNLSCTLTYWGDYDGDEDFDLVFSGANAEGDIVYLIKNDMDGFSLVDSLNIGTGGGVPFSSGLSLGSIHRNQGLSMFASAEEVAGVFSITDDQFVNFEAGIGSFTDSYGKLADFDNDGAADLILLGDGIEGNLGTKLYWSRNNHLVDSGQAFINCSVGSLDTGDYDNDGDLDILISGTTDGYPRMVTKLYRNDNGYFYEVAANLVGVFYADAKFGDYDNDGDLDIVVMGIGYNEAISKYDKITKLFRNDNGVFVESGIALPGTSQGHLAWGDVNNDGYFDLMITGVGPLGNGFDATTQVMINTNGQFMDCGARLPQVSHSCLIPGDVDNDGDLDLLLSGELSKIYQNDSLVPNSRPSAPSNLHSEEIGDYYWFYWNPSVDDHTPTAGISYNLRIGSTPGSGDILYAPSLANGYHRLAQRGMINSNCSWKIQKAVLDTLTTWFWSVQAIDTSYSGSPFAPDIMMGIQEFHAPQNVSIALVNHEIVLSWDEVNQDTQGQPISISGYLIYSSPQPDGVFYPILVVSPDATSCNLGSQRTKKQEYFYISAFEIDTSREEDFIAEKFRNNPHFRDTRQRIRK